MLAVKIVRDAHALNGVVQGNHFSHGHCLQNHGYSKSKDVYYGDKGDKPERTADIHTTFLTKLAAWLQGGKCRSVGPL